MSFPMALSLFLAGNCASHVRLPDVVRGLFLQKAGLPLWFSVALGGGILLSLYIVAVLDAAYLPEQVAVLIIIWSVLAVAQGIGEYLPRVNDVLAWGGASVIFAYGVHMPTFRMYTSTWLRILNQFPPPWMDCLVIFLMLVGCGYVYRRFVGRNRVVDAFIFGR